MKLINTCATLFAVLICSVFSSFTFDNNPSGKQTPIAGEWSNTDPQAKLQLMKFFPNGLLNIHTGNTNKVCNYKIISYYTSASVTTVNGTIEAGNMAHPAKYNQYTAPVDENAVFSKVSMSDADQKTFRATIINDKVMTLIINSERSSLTLNLRKTKSLPSGVMPIQ